LAFYCLHHSRRKQKPKIGGLWPWLIRIRGQLNDIATCNQPQCRAGGEYCVILQDFSLTVFIHFIFLTVKAFKHPRPKLAQAEIYALNHAFFVYMAALSNLRPAFFNLPVLQSDKMIHETIAKATAQKDRKTARKPRRPLIGGREILLLLIAFSLLALAPSIAQVVSKHSASPQAQPVLGFAERAETNFPGSAFYFQEQDYIVAPSQQAIAAAQGDGNALLQDGSYSDALRDSIQNPDDGSGIVGAAQPFVMNAQGSDYARAVKCLTDAIYYEAATEADAGQRAVAQVILNRMRHPTYPNNVCGVVYQGSERSTGCQFSYSCDGSMARIPSRFHWLRAQRVAMSALAGYVYAPVGMATHYHTVNVYPYWAPSLHFIGTIGAHRFYSWKGSAGRPSAFFRRYAGNEPFPGPKAKVYTPSTAPSLDPLQLQKQYEREFAAARLKAEKEAQAGIASAIGPAAPYDAITPQRQRAAPVYKMPDYSSAARKLGGEANYAGERLPEATNIKPEFQSSGTWKSQPTG
jgi:spore germination cell wall hydrolase CwlJ-like protein